MVAIEINSIYLASMGRKIPGSNWVGHTLLGYLREILKGKRELDRKE